MTHRCAAACKSGITSLSTYPHDSVEESSCLLVCSAEKYKVVERAGAHTADTARAPAAHQHAGWLDQLTRGRCDQA